MKCHSIRVKIHAIAITVAMAGATALPGLSLAETVVSKWNSAALQAVRITRPAPPVVARALAVANTCMYDAWAAYDDRAIGTRLGGALRRPAAERTAANKDQAVSIAAYRALVDLFPSEAPAFNALLSSLGYTATDTISTATPAGIGNVACKALLDFRHADGANQLGDLNGGARYSDYTGYAPVNTPDVVNDPNRWQPLRIGTTVQKFAVPHWSKVLPFALTKAAQFRPKPPQPFGSAGYLEQARQIVSYSASLTDTQKAISEYWADGPATELPPGHWVLFAQWVSQRDGNSVDQDAKMFFALTNALLDASIAAWDAKRHYDYARPVTAVRMLFKGQQIPAWAGPGLGTRLIAGETWQPYQASNFVTPPFAEYVSGHSLFSMASATVLKLFTGSDVFGGSAIVPARSSRIEPGLVPQADIQLTWANFSDAANEAGLSRRYGGIHFMEGDLASRDMGVKVGKQAWKKARSYFDPRRHDDDRHERDDD
jgi:hypothetical protein